MGNDGDFGDVVNFWSSLDLKLPLPEGYDLHLAAWPQCRHLPHLVLQVWELWDTPIWLYSCLQQLLGLVFSLGSLNLLLLACYYRKQMFRYWSPATVYANLWKIFSWKNGVNTSFFFTPCPEYNFPSHLNFFLGLIILFLSLLLIMYDFGSYDFFNTFGPHFFFLILWIQFFRLMSINFFNDHQIWTTSLNAWKLWLSFSLIFLPTYSVTPLCHLSVLSLLSETFFLFYHKVFYYRSSTRDFMCLK